MPRGGSTATFTPEDFVLVWQKAKSLEDVSDALGQSLSTVRNRASRYRIKGVPLKVLTSHFVSKPSKLGTPVVVDWGALASLARSLSPGA